MMKRVLTAAGMLAAVVAGQGQAVAAATAGWAVAGSVTPSSCGLTLSDAGTAAFGTLTAATIQGWAVQTAPVRYSGIEAKVFKTINLHVTCTAPTKFALSFVDNRMSTVSGPGEQGYSFGLGSYTPVGGQAGNIGRYVVRYDELRIKPLAGSAEARPVNTLLTAGSAAPTSNWATASGNDAVYLPSGKSLAFTAGATTAPDALVSVAGPLEFAFEPLKAVVDSANTNIEFDGAATITLIAL